MYRTKVSVVNGCKCIFAISVIVGTMHALTIMYGFVVESE